MTPAILLTGKNGQVGEELLRVLPRLGNLTALGRQELDLSRPEDVRRIIREVRPNLIVNAAAYTAVDQAERDEAAARAINADAPAVMAEEAKRIGATLVHYSTDYVFDGSKKSPYGETDPTNPLNVYGQTKLEGEEAIRNSGVAHLIFRTSWVYATRGKNFLLTILRLATQREELRIVQDQTGAPTWSREIASATSRILAQQLQENGGSSFQGRTGTYHMTASGETTWYDFARAILEESSGTPQTASWFAAATNGRALVTRRVVPITTEEFPTPASRPLYSVLSNSLLTKTFGVALPNWREQMNATFTSV
jgi:dTDP-4-dehydrorhamnose reductase